MDRNQKKLLAIIAVMLLLSGVLFGKGLSVSGEQVRDLIEVGKASPAPQSSALGVSFESSSESSPEASSVLGLPSIKAVVTRVVDGDTVEISLDGQAQKLRYIGINTPETVDPRRPVQCFGKEASNENKKLVEGREVYLDKDVSETDRYGRLLRFVYLKQPDGGVLFVNDYLVRQGFAEASTFPPDVKMSEQFKEAQEEARVNNRGLWGKCS